MQAAGNTAPAKIRMNKPKTALHNPRRQPEKDRLAMLSGSDFKDRNSVDIYRTLLCLFFSAAGPRLSGSLR